MLFLRLNGRLADLAARDPLTGTLIRNGLDDMVRRHFARRNAPPHSSRRDAHLCLDEGNDIVTFKTHDGAGTELAAGARVQLLPDFARSLWFDANGSALAGTAT